MTTFTYSAAPQRSPEWYAIRLGRVTASRLSDWLAVSKAKKTEGQPLKARLDYEKELMFERQFDAMFDRYVTDAMQKGVDLEDFARHQYERLTDSVVEQVGCWYSDSFVASPDGAIGDNGLIEIKILGDASFMDVLLNGVPDKYKKQIQGQLWASGRQWCDFVALNTNTKKVKIIRVTPDTEFHAYLELSLTEQLVVDEFSEVDVYDLPDRLPSFDSGFITQASTPKTEGTPAW